LKLREEPDMPAGMRVGMKQIALQQETVGRIGNASEGGIAVKIPAQAGLAADGKIRIRRIFAE